MSTMTASRMKRKTTEKDCQDIRICGFMLSILSFILFMAAELVEDIHTYHGSILILVALGALGFAWVGPLTLLAGTLKSSKFKWWQPFEGGSDFIWLQAFGWSLHAVVMAASVVILANYQSKKLFEGQYFLLGVCGFFAQIVLNLSIGCFREEDAGTAELFKFMVNPKGIVSLFISASGFLLFIFHDLYADIAESSIVVALGCVQFIIAAVLTHVFNGCKEIPGFHVWQPFEGGKTFLLLQYLGWQFFAATMAGSLILCTSRGSYLLYFSKGIPTIVGTMGMISQLVLVLSLQHFDKSAASHHHQSSHSCKSCDTDHDKQCLNPSSKLLPEVFMSTLFCATSVCVNCMIFCTREYSYLFLPQIVLFFDSHKSILWIISNFALFLAVPMVHLGGVRAIPYYTWWQPFRGGTKFAFLQALGWLWYAFFLALAIIIYLNDENFMEFVVPLVILLGIAACAAISLSLRYFIVRQPIEMNSTRRCPRIITTEKLEEKSSVANSESSYARSTTEVIAGIVLSLSNLLFHIFVDYFNKKMKLSLKIVFLSIGTLLSVLGCFVTHASGRQRYSSYRVWQPFKGGDRFVLRQALSWTLVAAHILLESLVLSLSSWDLPFGVFSMSGVLSLFPQVILISSLEVFEHHKHNFRRFSSSAVAAANASTWKVLLQSKSFRWRAWVNILLACGSMTFFISAECIRQRQSHLLSFHVDEILFAFGCMTSLCGVVFAHCFCGTRIHPTYQLFQPFCGGIRFIAYQGVAWTLVSIAWILSCTIFYWKTIFFRIAGLHLVVGFLYVSSQIVLLHSLPLYRAPSDDDLDTNDQLVFSPLQRSPSSTSGLRSVGKGGFLSPHSSPFGGEKSRGHGMTKMEFVVGPLLGIASCLIFALVDFAIVQFGASIPVFPMTVCAVIALFSSIPMSYRFSSSSFAAQLRACCGGNILFVVLGSALWSFTLLLGGVFSYHVWMIEGETLSPAPISHTRYGSCMDSPFEFESPHSSNGINVQPFPNLGTQFLGTFTSFMGFAAQLLFLYATESTKSSPGKAKVVTNMKQQLFSSSFPWSYALFALLCGVGFTGARLKAVSIAVLPVVAPLLVCCMILLFLAMWVQQEYKIVYMTGLSTSLKSPSHAIVKGKHAAEFYRFLAGFDGGCDQHFISFLTAADLVNLSSTCKYLQELYTDRFWYLLFQRRFVANYSTLSNCQIQPVDSFHLSSTMDIFSATKLNCFEELALNLVCRFQIPCQPPALKETPSLEPSDNKWKIVCSTLERQGAFEQCVLCNKVEIFSSKALLWENLLSCNKHAPTTWVTLCRCINPITRQVQKAHRTCLEAQIRMEREVEMPIDLNRVYYCNICLVGPSISSRLPKTLKELSEVTRHDYHADARGAEDYGGGFFLFVPGSSALFLYVLRQFGWSTGVGSLEIWVIMMVALCFVVNSSRFDQCLRASQMDSRSAEEGEQQDQERPRTNFPTASWTAYQRYYHCIMMSSIIHLVWYYCASYPSSTGSSAANDLSTWLWSLVGVCCFALNFVVFLVYGVLSLFLFWRTQYRVLTLDHAQGVDRAKESIAIDTKQTCVLCLLHLCVEYPVQIAVDRTRNEEDDAEAAEAMAMALGM